MGNIAQDRDSAPVLAALRLRIESGAVAESELPDEVRQGGSVYVRQAGVSLYMCELRITGILGSSYQGPYGHDPILRAHVGGWFAKRSIGA